MTEETKLPESEMSADVSEERVTATEDVSEERAAEAEQAASAEEEQAAEATAAEATEEETTETEATAAEAAVEESNEAESLSVEDIDDMMSIKDGDVLKGHVVKVEADRVYVDVGYKYDGIITIRELSSLHLEDASEAVQVNDEIECKVLSIDDENERLLLSKRAVDSEKAWEDLQAKFDSQEVFEAKVAEVVKGGLVVDVGVRGFIPASMVERHYVEDFSDYKGRTLRLVVKEYDRAERRVILSQRDVLDAEYEEKKQQLLNSIEPGQLLEGTVQRLTTFGAFVDVGGVDGLVHISEMAWEHVEHPSDVVQEGDVITVKVLKVDPENERISLSIKEAQPGPWETLQDKFNVGDIIEGKVMRLASFGAFVEIIPGVEGLVHISQISHQHIGTPHEVLSEGQQVNVKILDINPAEQRVSLSIKETEERPARAERSEQVNAKDVADNENVSLNSTGLNLTLGERFGDKLSKFK